MTDKVLDGLPGELCDGTARDDAGPSGLGGSPVRGAVAWHVAGGLRTLRGQLDALAPHRSTAADGTIGDAAHASRTSDHNPWYQDTVTAEDFTHDPAGGLDGQRLADALVRSGDRRIKYVIWNEQIWQRATGWQAYHGINPHTHHVHLSVVASPLCESTTPWVLPGLALGPGPRPAPSGRRELALTDPHMTGPDVGEVQRVLRAWYALPASFVDDDYGPQTVQYVKRAQAGTPPAPKLDADGRVGDLTRRKLGI